MSSDINLSHNFRPKYEVADIFRDHWKEYLKINSVSLSIRKVIQRN